MSDNSIGEQIVREQFSGMSLRDWFAGMALQGAWANPDLSQAMSKAGMKPYEVRESLASSAYAQADTMLKESCRS